MSWAARAARALGAAVLLAGLAVGVPVLLAHAVGWPLPRRLPSWEEVQAFLDSGAVDDRTLVKAVAVVGWAAWLQLVVALTAEVVATARRRVAGRASFVPRVQEVAARLLATALMATSLSSRPALAAPGSPAPVEEVLRPPEGGDRRAATTADVLPPQRVAVPAAAPGPFGDGERAGYWTRRGDNYWRLAERFLGDGFRWRELRAPNVGRTMPDGTVIAADSDELHPGWLLLLPSEIDPDAPGVVSVDAGGNASAVAAPLEGEGQRSVTVTTGDGTSGLWGIAEGALRAATDRVPTEEEVAAYWSRLIEENRNRLVDPADADLILPGQEFVLPPIPGAPGRAPAAPPPTPRPTGEAGAPSPGEARPKPPPPPSAPGPRVGDEGTRDGGEEPSGEVPWLPVAGLLGVAGTGMALGLTRALRRLGVRRRQLAPDALAANPPSPRFDDLRAELVRAGDRDEYQRARDALVALGRHHSSTPGARWRPRLLQVGGDEVEVLLTEPIPRAPAGWRAEAQGAVWRRRSDEAGAAAGADDGEAEVAARLLVSVGRRENSGQIYLDLEAERLVALVGDGEGPARLAAAMVTELVHSPLSAPLGVLVVGDLGDPSLGRFDHVRIAGDFAEVSRHVVAWAEQSAAVLEHGGFAHAFAARAVDPYLDGLAPLLVVCAGLPDDESFDALCALVGTTPTTVTVVVVGDEVPGATRVEVAGGELSIDAVGLRCRAQSIEPSVTAEAADLLEETARLPEPPAPPEPPVPGDAAHGAAPGANGQTAPHAPPQSPGVPSPLAPAGEAPVEADGPVPAAAPGAPGEGDGAGADGPTTEVARPVEAPAPLGGHPGQPAAMPRPVPSSTPYEDPPYDVVVRVLGDLAVEGASRPLRPKEAAVVTYVALHGPVTGERVTNAIWSMPTSEQGHRLAHTAYECRGALGMEHFPRAEDGRYRVGPRVVTDLDLFARRRAAARGQPPAVAIPVLQGALELVSGPVFSYRNAERRSYVWVDLENWIATTELDVVETALELGQLCLEAGDFDGAASAALRGLAACQLDSRLTELAMRAYAERGDFKAAEQTYLSHVTALERLDIDDVAESTLDLYDAIQARRRGSGSEDGDEATSEDTDAV